MLLGYINTYKSEGHGLQNLGKNNNYITMKLYLSDVTRLKRVGKQYRNLLGFVIVIFSCWLKSTRWGSKFCRQHVQIIFCMKVNAFWFRPPVVRLSVRQLFFKSNRLPQFLSEVSDISLVCAQQYWPKTCGIWNFGFLLRIFYSNQQNWVKIIIFGVFGHFIKQFYCVTWNLVHKHVRIFSGVCIELKKPYFRALFDTN